jgi:hypothetical protein
LLLCIRVVFRLGEGLGDMSLLFKFCVRNSKSKKFQTEGKTILLHCYYGF